MGLLEGQNIGLYSENVSEGYSPSYITMDKNKVRDLHDKFDDIKNRSFKLTKHFLNSSSFFEEKISLDLKKIKYKFNKF